MATADARNRRSIHNLLITLTAAITMGLVGCAPQSPDPVGQVSFDGYGNATSLVKPANSEQSLIFATAYQSPTSASGLPGDDLDSGFETFAPTATDSSQADDDSNSSAAREEEEEQEASRGACKEDDLFGNLSVEIDGPAAAFMDDNISKSIKIAIYNDNPSDSSKVQIIVRLSKDSQPDEQDLILTGPEQLVAGPGAFSEQQVDPGALQPLVGIESGKYHIIVSIDEVEFSGHCIIDDNIASFPLEVI